MAERQSGYVGHAQPHVINAAYIAALQGDFAPVTELRPEVDRRIVVAAATCLGVVVPEAVPGKRALPPTRALADAIAVKPVALPTLQLTAEVLDGAQRRGAKVAEGTASALGRAGLIASAGELVGHPARTRKEHLTMAASNRITALYHVSYHRPEHISPWLWADLLIRLTGDLYGQVVPDYAFVRMAARYIQSYETSVANQPDPTTHLSLMAMYRRVAPDGDSIVKAIELLNEQQGGAQLDRQAQRAISRLGEVVRSGARAFGRAEIKAHQTRQKTWSKFQPPARPRPPAGEALTKLQLSNRRYQAVTVLQPAQINERCIASLSVIDTLAALDGEDISNGYAEYESLAETWAALVERSVTNDTYRREFVELGDATGVWVLPHLASYLPTQTRRLASGTASLGVVRLVANHGNPGYNLWPIPGVTDELLDQLDIGAAAWYGQRASKVLTADIRMAIREAYILERLHSPALPSSPELRTMRLQRLASITLLERRLPLLPPRVQVLLISAKKMVGLGPGV